MHIKFPAQGREKERERQREKKKKKKKSIMGGWWFKLVILGIFLRTQTYSENNKIA